MRILIMGCSKLGAFLTRSLVGEGHQVVLIDTDPAGFACLSPQGDVDSVIGDGTVADDLRRAGIEQAQAFLALSGDDNQNAMAAQVARHIFHVPKAICLLGDPERQEVYNRLGLEVVCPTTAVVKVIREALQG